MKGYRARGSAEPKRVGSVLISSLIAGPLVVIEVFVAPLLWILVESPADLVGPWDATTLIPLLLIAMIVGFLPALFASMIGIAAMRALQEEFAAARSRSAWMLAGFLLAVPIAILLPGVPSIVAALLLGVAGSICGYVCWRFEHLSPEP